MRPDFELATGPTYAHRVLDAFERFSSRIALRYKSEGAWNDITYADLGKRVLACAAALKRRGIGPGDHVAMWLGTSWPWVVVDLAVQLLGAVTVTIYHTLPPVQAAGILRDAGVRALLTTAERLEGLSGEGGASNIVPFTVLTGDAPDEGGVIGLNTLLSEGAVARNEDAALARALLVPRIEPGDLSAIIYTSGTTGEPKGAMLTHANVLSNAEGAITCYSPGQVHTILLHVPLAHTMARNTTLASILLSGGTAALAEPEREKLPQNLVETAPTLFVTVPYMLDKFVARVRENIASKGAIGRFLAKRAIRAGRRRLAAIPEGGGPVRQVPTGLELAILDRRVLRKIRARLGGRLQCIVIGAASSNRESIEFFWGLGIPVYEAYGATEVTNLATCACPGDMRLGTVGRAAPGMEVRLAEDGEVLIRGPNLMKGYWNRPEATREAIDTEGWYHSGDLGEFDDGGYLKIVDRKKEIFALTTGKKVAPQAVENALKLSPCIANACTIGDRRRYISALIVPDLAIIQQRLGLAAPPPADAVHELIAAEIERASGGLADFERVKRFTVVPEPFTVENGLLTPTLKVRRKEIGARFAREIELLYSG